MRARARVCVNRPVIDLQKRFNLNKVTLQHAILWLCMVDTCRLLHMHVGLAADAGLTDALTD